MASGHRATAEDLAVAPARLEPWRRLILPVFRGVEHVPADRPFLLVGSHLRMGRARRAADGARMSRIAENRRWPAHRAVGAILVVIACAVSGVLSRPADARVRQPITLRIEGFLDAAPEGVRPQRKIQVRIGRDETRTLAVTRLTNQGAGPHGQTILGDAARYRPAFRLVGDEALVAKLAGAPQGARVTLTGNLSSGRNVLLTIADVEPVAGPSPAPVASPDAAASPGAGG